MARTKNGETWRRHQMEPFSALLALCAGNSPVSGEFPAQRPVTRSFDVFFDLRVNRRLSKQSWGWWFETLSYSLWRHRNDHKDMHPSLPWELCSNIGTCPHHDHAIHWKGLLYYCPFVRGIHRWPMGSPHKRLIIWSTYALFILSLNKMFHK